MRTVVLTLSAVLLVLSIQPAGASNAVSLGYSDETTIVGPERECSSGTLFHNHDGSFENGYTWQYGGVATPYYGALGEAYDLGRGTIRCAAFWFTTIFGGWGWYPPTDCYVWEGGIEGQPGSVLAVVTGVEFHGIPFWPAVGEFDVDMNAGVDGTFTIGYWPNAPGMGSELFCAADESGPGGHPWTCIAPGTGYPSGWQSPSVVWPNAKASGCGVYFESNPTPAESPTWGAIKAMYR